MPIRARADRSLVRAGARSRRVVQVDVTAPEAAPGGVRPRLALSLVLDRSGSMEGKKIDLARQAAVSAIRSLGTGDRFAVVVYDDQVDVLQPAVDVAPEAVAAAERAIGGVAARNATDLHAGWEAACREAVGARRDGRVGRVLLLSDGLANHGLTGRGEIALRASEQRLSGVTTSTFGIGADYDEGLLSAMAEAGGGNFRFVATAGEIPEDVADEVSEVLAMSLPETELRVTGPGGLEVECPNGFPVRYEADSWRVAIGSLVSEQRLAFVLDVRFPAAEEGTAVPVVLDLLSRGGPAGAAPVEIVFTAAGHAANDRQPCDVEVRRERARVEDRRCRRRALELNREKDTEGAAALARTAAERMRLYAWGDAEVLEIVRRLEAEALELGRPMESRLLKERHALAYYASKGRAVQGSAARRSRLRTMTAAQPDLAGVLAEAADAFRVERVSTFGCLPDLLEDDEMPDGWVDVSPLSPADEKELADGLRRRWSRNDAAVLVFVTPRPLADGWFSHWHDGQAVAIASTSGVADITGVPLAAFVAYETFLHGLREAGIAPERLMHDDRGCLYDLCETRDGLDRKLREGAFCDVCRRVLERAGLLPEPAGTIARVIRSLAASPVPGVN